MISRIWIHEKKYPTGKKTSNLYKNVGLIRPPCYGNSLAIIAITIILIQIPVTNSTEITAILIPITLIQIPVTNSTAILYTVKKQY